MKTLVVIPAYNEEKNISRVINEIKKFETSSDVLVVDDGSQDKTAFIAQEGGEAEVIRLPHNLGVGGAVQTAFKYAKDRNYELIVRVDGDGQHRAESIALLKKPILEGKADMVIGSRFLSKERPRSVLSRRIGQKIIGFLITLLSGQKITDAVSGFRCYGKNTVDLLVKYYPNDYPEPEEIILLKKNRFRIKEVAVLMREREDGVSSVTFLKSIYLGIKVFLAILIAILRSPVIK